MKTTIKYVADDGTEYQSEEACRRYETVCAAVAEAEALVQQPPRRLENGVFFQLDASAVLTMQRRLTEIFEREHWRDAHTEWARTATVPAGMTLIGRYVDDAGYPCERRAWWRIQCTDRFFRQWSQPYYASLEAERRGAI